MRANEVDTYAHPFDDERVLYSVPEPEEEPPPLLQRLLLRLGIKLVPHAFPEMEESDDGEFDLRITYVPDDVLAANEEPDLPEVRLAALGRNAWGRTPRLLQSMLIFLLILFIIFVLFGNAIFTLFFAPFAQSQTQQTPSFVEGDTFPSVTHVETNFVATGPHHTMIVTARPIPQYCPTGTMIGQGRQAENFAVWLSGIDPETALVHLPPQTLKTTKGWKGWVVHLTVSSRYKSLNTISLNALNLYGLTQPLLHNASTTLYSQRIFIDAKHPSSFVGSANVPNIGIWNVNLYLPNAGCYALSASWGAGHWLINFAAGQ